MHQHTNDDPVTFALVGSGWRAQAYLRVARASSGAIRVAGVVSRSTPTIDIGGVPAFRSLPELLALSRPDFVVLCVPPGVRLPIAQQAESRGVPVVLETPPGESEAEVRAAWDHYRRHTIPVQAAEQHTRMPMVRAQVEVIEAGLIGTPVWAHVNATHAYHGVALARAYLGQGIAPARIHARSLTHRAVDPLDRAGWHPPSEVKDLAHELALIEFPEGRAALYEFTDSQWFNPVIPKHVTVRGHHGEISDTHLTRLIAPDLPATSTLVREVSGIGIDYRGADLTGIHGDGRLLYRNPFHGWGLTDDEIATAGFLLDMKRWLRGMGAEPYPLREAIHDTLIGLGMATAIRSGSAVDVDPPQA